jgi:hypothetical protein
MQTVVAGTPLTVNLVRAIRKINASIGVHVVVLASGDLSGATRGFRDS